MTKVITYGTYDLLHYGHIRLLERAKALGDYLIVGVTADDFDKTRGKINVKQSLMERIEAVRLTGLADEIIVEEYEGQKIDDIRRYDVDIFTVGSDWKGQFDYLNDYCKVVYLERTQGVSSSEIRAQENGVRLGLVGEAALLNKVANECNLVNGLEIVGVYSKDDSKFSKELKQIIFEGKSFEDFLSQVDAIYIASHPKLHYSQIKLALSMGKHVLCEAPIVLRISELRELKNTATQHHCILMDAIKTAYSTAYYRLLLLVKSGKIGDIISVDATCTSLSSLCDFTEEDFRTEWNSICGWGPTALLPIFQILGTEYIDHKIVSCIANERYLFDSFSKIDFVYPNAVATLKVGKGIKSEGELIISGTKGYFYVPAPWWKTDYFEARFEDAKENKRYFYQLDGEGIRYELVAFLKSIETMNEKSYIEDTVTSAIIRIMEEYFSKTNLTLLS